MTDTMAKFLALFNVLAGGASLIGLYATFYTERSSAVMAILFAVTFALSAYVLLVPRNRLERNVSSRFRLYRKPDSLDTLAFQQGEITVQGDSIPAIIFDRPFHTMPEIEVIKLSGHYSIELKVKLVTLNQLQLEATQMILSFHSAKFRWIAKGIVLAEVHGDEA